LDQISVSGFNNDQAKQETVMIVIEGIDKVEPQQTAVQLNPVSLILKLIAQIELWMSRHKQRQALLSLDDHLLKDIGKSRVDALKEANKPFWKP
jgi:uncharacterized protein YjiS (DUF1127 family)